MTLLHKILSYYSTFKRCIKCKEIILNSERYIRQSVIQLILKTFYFFPKIYSNITIIIIKMFLKIRQIKINKDFTRKSMSDKINYIELIFINFRCFFAQVFLLRCFLWLFHVSIRSTWIMQEQKTLHFSFWDISATSNWKLGMVINNKI